MSQDVKPAMATTHDPTDGDAAEGHHTHIGLTTVSGGVEGESTLDLLDDNGQTAAPPGECWGVRHTLGLLGCLAFATVYAMRVNLSVAIVAMVKEDDVTDNNTISNNDTLVCPEPGGDGGDDGGTDGEFYWSEPTQGLILGCFFYGYLFTNVLGGMAAERWGGRMVLGLGVVLTAVLTLLSPVCARLSTELFVAVRILEGATEGVTFPAMNVMLASWIPPLERSKFSSFVFAGVQLGTVITMPVSGWLCDSTFLGGWPAVFYVFGALGLVWGVFWFVLVRDDPCKHPRISAQEKAYILAHCGAKKEKAVAVPWGAIFTSPPVWALIIVHFGQNWGFYTLLTELPTYLKNIQHFDMKSNGLLSALPYAVMWVFSLCYSNVVDAVLKRGYLSILNVRRMSMVIGLYVPMVALIVMCLVGCDYVLAMVVLCVAVGFNGSIYCGYMCSHQDMAPNLAGSLMGLTNTVATIPGFVAPQVVGAITKDGNQTLTAWATIFLISAGVYLVANTVYLVLITATVQPWNEPKHKDNHDDDKKRY